jgi:hypothetical protein
MSIGVSDEQFSGSPKRGALGNGIIAIRAITQSARGANTALKHAHWPKNICSPKIPVHEFPL